MHSSHSMTVGGHWRANVSTTYAEKKSNNWQALLENVSNVCFLVRQSLPLRGDGDRSDSNLSCTFFVKKITKFWKNGGRKRTHKYSRNSIQNEMMKIMALQILGKIAKNEAMKQLMFQLSLNWWFVWDGLTMTLSHMTLHKKSSFSLRISSVNETKSARTCGFGQIYWRNP